MGCADLGVRRFYFRARLGRSCITIGRIWKCANCGTNRGWMAWRCVEGRELYSEPAIQERLHRMDEGLIRYGQFEPLPYLPLIAGLAGDVLIWSIVATAAWSALSRLTRMMFARKRDSLGCCSVCGYCRLGIAADAVCPECGSIANATVAGASGSSTRGHEIGSMARNENTGR